MRTALLSLLIAATCVGILWLRFNAPSPERGLVYPHDLLYSYTPKVDLIGSRLASLELPLWNPAGCAGMPLLGAVQNAILYPPMWISALLPAGLALSFLTLLHLLIAAAGASLLFREWRAPPLLAGALGGTFVFACALGQTFWPPQVFAITWLPWMLLCIERALAAPSSWRWWSGLIAVTAMQLLSGFPQHVIYTLQLAVPLLLLRAVLVSRDTGATPIRAVARIGVALALGAGIASAQLLPAFELIQQSERRESVSPQEAHYLQNKPRLTTILSNAVNAEPRNTAFEVGKGVGYVGAGTLVLAAVALVLLRRRPLVWLLTSCAAAFLLLSDGYLGVARSAYEAYAALPLVGSFRSPERLLLLAGFSVIALAALGASTLTAPLTAPLTATGTAPLTASRTAARRRERLLGAATAALASAMVALLGNWQAGLVAIATACLISCIFFVPDRRIRGAIEAAMAVLLLADVALATGSYGSMRHIPTGWAEVMHVGGRTFMSVPDFEAQQQRIGNGRASFYGKRMLIRPIGGVGPLRNANRLACYETPVPEAWQQVSRLVKGGDYRSAIAANVDPRRFASLLDLAGVVEVTEVHGPARREPGRVFEDNDSPIDPPRRGMSVTIRPRRGALPRAYVVGAYAVKTGVAAIQRVTRGNFDYRNMVLLDYEPKLPVERLDRMVPAEILDYRAERVEIATDTQAAGLLVLSDTYYPGWRATIDGQEVEILRANGLFRAVALPHGEHRVVFEYAPMSLRVGAAMSAIALFIAIGLSWQLRRSGSIG